MNNNKKSTSSLLVCMAATAVGLSACGGGTQTAQHTQTWHINKLAWKGQQPAVASAKLTAADKELLQSDEANLNIGDQVKVTTFGHEDLSGEFMVESNGNINLPLIGNIKAAGRTKDNLENAIRSKLAQGYLVDPKVSVEVANFRQFYIVGEVDEPGAYDYVSSLNVLKAVAIAGGFTRRAVTDDFIIVRRRQDAEQTIAANEESVVLPGDTVRVDERFF